MVSILVGEQPTGVAARSPSPDYFCEISFAEKDDDLARKMRGCGMSTLFHTTKLRGNCLLNAIGVK